MEYLKLTLGIVLLAAFVFIFIKNIGRKGFIHSLLRMDTIAGIVAGVYLIATSTLALFV
jgi:hypothetical protein